MSKHQIACHKCHALWTFEGTLGRRDECPQCRADAKVCLNCRFYDPGAHHECREEQAEWVKEKTSGNFCGFFEALAIPNRRGVETDAAKAKLVGLFGGLPESVEEKRPGASLADELRRFLEKK